MLHVRIELLIRNIRATLEYCLQCLYSGVISSTILAMAMIFVVPVSVSAGEVLGKVTLDKKPAGGKTLEFRRVDRADQGIPVIVRTNENGEYRIFLEPGEYEARLADAPDAEARIVRSFTERIQENLQF